MDGLKSVVVTDRDGVVIVSGVYAFFSHGRLQSSTPFTMP